MYLTNLWRLLFFLVLPVIMMLNCRLEMNLQKQTETVQTETEPTRTWDTSYYSSYSGMADFNGDGHNDTFNTNSAYNVNSISNSGKVSVYYGNDAVADQNLPGILGMCETDDFLAGMQYPEILMVMGMMIWPLGCHRKPLVV